MNRNPYLFLCGYTHGEDEKYKSIEKGGAETWHCLKMDIKQLQGQN